MDMGTEVLNNNKNWSSSSPTSASLLPVDEYDDPDRRGSVASTGSTGFASFLRGRRVSSRRDSDESASTSSTGRRESSPYVVAQSLFLEDKPAGGSSGRRRSWHVTKLDRKRRKGVVSPTDSDTYDRRQKRPSWWNIFVPDNLKHRSSRRASVAQETSEPPVFVPYQRSKSRSVDHGFSTPFDLDALRSTVEERFQAVGPHRQDTDGVGGSARDLSEKRMGKTVQPINTTTYTVRDSDTLTSVAARFDTTPSELAKMNRLATRLVFPGQVLFVPDRRRRAASGGGSGGGAGDSGEAGDGSGSGPGSLDGGGSIGESDDDALADSSPLSASLSASPIARTLPQDSAHENAHHAAPRSGPGLLHRFGHASRPRRELEGFLKITVRHITDGQGVVEGVLLVTPNAFMFDPNVSDTLVIERGPESYGVFAPMEFVVNAAIYFDIAHMRVGDSAPPKVDAPKPEIYRLPTKEPEELKSVDEVSNSNLVKDDTFSELAPARSSTEEEDDDAGDTDSLCSARREGDAFPKAFERDLVTPTQMTVSQTWEKEGHAADAAAAAAAATDPNAPTDANAAPGETKSLSERSDSVSGPDDAYSMQRKLEERRMSSLDHHWAVPKHKWSQESRDADNEAEPEGEPEREAERETEQEAERDAEVEQDKRPLGDADADADAGLVKSSCHDSGIDIRDADQVPPPPILPFTKKVFSDADIILAPKNEFVPPITVAPSSILGQLEGPGGGLGGPNVGSMLAPAPPGRKKTSSVSFSVDDDVKEAPKDEDHDKQESRRNKMLKRLSYPLAWMEGLGGEKEEKDSLPGLPSSADSQSQHSSMFSKVFSSSPINLVSDLGSGLFLMKTPSEESGGSGGTRGPSPGPPPHTPGPLDPPASPEIREVLKEGLETGFSVVGNTATNIISSVSNVGRSSVGTFIGRQQTDAKEHKSDRVKQAAPKLDIRSMVSVDDMPELFVSFDIHAPMFPLLEEIELIPRPARPCDDPPLYLRLRMGKPMNREIPRSTQIMSYGKKRMRPEYWFSVPRNRVEDLYKFLMLWIPERYGDLEDMDLAARGYELVETDTALWDDESGADDSGEAGRRSAEDGELRELTRESWEMVKAPYLKLYSIIKTQTMSADSEQNEELASMSDELRRAIYATNGASFDTDILPPDLIGVTEILTEDHRKELCRHLPARAEGYLWTLVFSTSQNGFSLNSMYRKMQRLESPILMVIQDTNNNVFGALTSCALKVSDHFYGTGESLLFRFNPQFQVYNWTGDNMYFIKGNNESLAIGAGDGRFGLWLDGDLYQGRSQPCNTYGNDALSVNEDFVVKTLECWAFV